jgi:hypothetical protein
MLITKPHKFLISLSKIKKIHKVSHLKNGIFIKGNKVKLIEKMRLGIIRWCWKILIRVKIKTILFKIWINILWNKVHKIIIKN